MAATADVFEEHRSHLLGVAYRLTGTLADAEDAVQDAWLRMARLSEADRAAIRDPRGWLTTVVGRLCLDRLRSAAVQRERYVGPWLPEPLLSPWDAAASRDPLDEVVRDEGVRMAALVVLDELTPEQRVAFVLHDALAIPFAEIGDVLGCSAAAARQHASRARRIVTSADPPARVELAEQRQVLDAFLAALAGGDLTAVVGLLHPDVVLIGDGGGKERTARRPVRGADKVARFLLGLLARYGSGQLVPAQLVLVNGDLGMLIPPWPGDPEHPVPAAGRVSCFAVREGQVAAIYDIVNPDKLSRVFDS
ncbi:MAG TPA: sigma-70 family RNA polymerase sigma factor [Pseudonocardiaceae bacterium]|nr:sigma-70 family RNA polymerase sigma factor [Pseudonocardiaceae bacterium]